MAVVVYYRARLAALVRGVLARDPASLRLALALGVAFAPAAAIGLQLHRRRTCSARGPSLSPWWSAAS
jgi:undecaprenyl-diphosphatase